MRIPAELPATLLAIAEAQEGLLSSQQCERHGVGRSRRAGWLRSGRWQVVTRGVVDTIPVPPRRRTVADVPRHALPAFVRTDVGFAVHRSARATTAVQRERSPRDLLFDHLRRRAAWVALLAYGPESIAVGRCALALLGVEGLPPVIRPEAAMPRASKRLSRPDVVLRQFDDGLTTVAWGDRRTGSRLVASPERAIAQAVPELPLDNGLAVLDSVLRLELLTRAGAARAHDHARGRRGVALRHELWEQADPRAESWLESAGRWQCIEEGVDPDVLQLPVECPDGRVRFGDMAWSLGDRGWLVAELDGYEWHEGVERSERRDRDRDNALAQVPGIRVLHFDARHVHDRSVGRQVREFLSRAAPNRRFRTS